MRAEPTVIEYLTSTSTTTTSPPWHPPSGSGPRSRCRSGSLRGSSAMNWRRTASPSSGASVAWKRRSWSRGVTAVRWSACSDVLRDAAAGTTAADIGDVLCRKVIRPSEAFRLMHGSTEVGDVSQIVPTANLLTCCQPLGVSRPLLEDHCRRGRRHGGAAWTTPPNPMPSTDGRHRGRARCRSGPPRVAHRGRDVERPLSTGRGEEPRSGADRESPCRRDSPPDRRARPPPANRNRPRSRRRCGRRRR
jgi:hypothetical protein